MDTRSENPAAAILDRLAAGARRLGVDDPAPALRGLFARTFARPLSDPSYRTNQLQPGALPLEWSFSEADPESLRLELQPFDPDLAPERRLRKALAALLPTIEAHHGRQLAGAFATAVGPPTLTGTPRFGAFVGVAVGPNQPPTFKLYRELDPDADEVPLGSVARIPGAVPRFRSVAVGSGAVAQRVYFFCRSGLRLLDLEPICGELGLAHRFPGLLVAILELTGGRFHLPPGSVLLGVRAGEIKVELISRLAAPLEAQLPRVERLLAPTAVPPFRRWVGFVQGDRAGAARASVVSVRASARASSLLSLYAAEPEDQLG